MSLPSTYQEVEYIQSTGTQYIRTGYNVSNKTNVKLKISDANFSSSTVGYLFGYYYSWNNSMFGIYYGRRGDNNGVTIFGANETGAGSGGIANGLVHEVEFGQNGLYVDNTKILTPSTQTFSGGNLGIFCKHGINTSLGEVWNEFGAFKLYYFKIYDNGTLVRNFVPCYRKSDNVAGLYDTVNNVFYTNAGTGTFIVGPTPAQSGKIKKFLLGTDLIRPKKGLGTSLPGYITDTSMLMNMVFSNNSFTDLTGNCTYQLHTGSITYTTDGNNTVGQFNSANILVSGQTLYTTTATRFYSLWYKGLATGNRVFNFTQQSNYSQLYLAMTETGCSFGREESNRGGVGSYASEDLLNKWHLYGIWYDGAGNSTLYLDGVQVATKSNTMSGYGCTPINQNIGSNGYKTCQSYYEGFSSGQMGQFLIYTSKPSDADILAYYNLTKPA